MATGTSGVAVAVNVTVVPAMAAEVAVMAKDPAAVGIFRLGSAATPLFCDTAVVVPAGVVKTTLMPGTRLPLASSRMTAGGVASVPTVAEKVAGVLASSVA